MARMGYWKSAYTVLMGKPEGKRTLGKNKRRWKDNVKRDLAEIEWGVGL